MNGKDLSDAIAKEFFLTKAESTEIIRLLLSKFSESLKRSERVYLRGFGSFAKQNAQAKKVRHPKTGKIITIPRRMRVSFKASDALLNQINEKGVSG